VWKQNNHGCLAFTVWYVGSHYESRYQHTGSKAGQQYATLAFRTHTQVVSDTWPEKCPGHGQHPHTLTHIPLVGYGYVCVCKARLGWSGYKIIPMREVYCSGEKGRCDSVSIGRKPTMSEARSDRRLGACWFVGPLGRNMGSWGSAAGEGGYFVKRGGSVVQRIPGRNPHWLSRVVQARW
jgi:hypothetical protein